MIRIWVIDIVGAMGALSREKEQQLRLIIEALTVYLSYLTEVLSHLLDSEPASEFCSCIIGMFYVYICYKSWHHNGWCPPVLLFPLPLGKRSHDAGPSHWPGFFQSQHFHYLLRPWPQYLLFSAQSFDPPRLDFFCSSFLLFNHQPFPHQMSMMSRCVESSGFKEHHWIWPSVSLGCCMERCYNASREWLDCFVSQSSKFSFLFIILIYYELKGIQIVKRYSLVSPFNLVDLLIANAKYFNNKNVD